MPLYRGKKNIGRNIKTEEAHGKPPNVALAIALHMAGMPRRVTKKKKLRRIRKGRSS